MKEYHIGIDVGGTSVKLGIVDRDCRILCRRSYGTPKGMDGSQAVDLIVSGIQSVLHACGLTSDGIASVGVGVPGTVRYGYGIVDSSPNFPKWHRFDIRRELSERLSVPVVVDNDAKMAAAGEKFAGAAVPYDNFVLVTIGTGIGGAVYANGLPVRGRDGTAGEIGHIVVEPEGMECGCGSNGCVEMYASAGAIVRYYRARSHDRSRAVTAEDVYRRAIMREPPAMYAFRQMGMYLGIALTDVVNLLNPEALIFTGKVSRAIRLFLPSVKAVVNRRAFRLPSRGIVYRKGTLGDDAAIIGAVCRARP
ncbi:MAG: ROK family protein [Deltaproteobacteria bacterium]|nr:ROK family protein [Deltaproteobacteria bacterium]MCL5276791.1 ROK family protein [Deltaproteobacteria bacterium]